MALRQSYTGQSDIPEAMREHYSEKDGRWILQTDPPSDDVTGLKSALESERRGRRDADTQLTEMKKRFDGMSPESYHEMQTQLDGLKDKQVYDKDGLDALVNRRTEQMRAETQRLITTKDRELEILRNKNTEIETSWTRERIQTGLTTALTKTGIRSDALTYGVDQGLKVFTEINEHGHLIAKQHDEVRYGKDGVNPLSPEEWAMGLRQDASFLWPSSAGGGANQNNVNGSGKPGTDYSKLPPAERLTRWREDEAAKR